MGEGVLIGPYLSAPKRTTLFSQRNSLDRGRFRHLLLVGIMM